MRSVNSDAKQLSELVTRVDHGELTVDVAQRVHSANYPPSTPQQPPAPSTARSSSSPTPTETCSHSSCWPSARPTKPLGEGRSSVMNQIPARSRAPARTDTGGAQAAVGRSVGTTRIAADECVPTSRVATLLIGHRRNVRRGGAGVTRPSRQTPGRRWVGFLVEPGAGASAREHWDSCPSTCTSNGFAICRSSDTRRPRSVSVHFSAGRSCWTRAMRCCYEPRRVVPWYAVPPDDLRLEVTELDPAPVPDLLQPVLPPHHNDWHTVPGRSLHLDGYGEVAFRPDEQCLGGRLIMQWEPFDWLEEDEPVMAHPHDPFKRIDVLHSHRHVRVEVGGVTLAESSRPMMLIETSLPVRWYLPSDDAPDGPAHGGGHTNGLRLQRRRDVLQRRRCPRCCMAVCQPASRRTPGEAHAQLLACRHRVRRWAGRRHFDAWRMRRRGEPHRQPRPASRRLHGGEEVPLHAVVRSDTTEHVATVLSIFGWSTVKAFELKGRILGSLRRYPS